MISVSSSNQPSWTWKSFRTIDHYTVPKAFKLRLESLFERIWIECKSQKLFLHQNYVAHWNIYSPFCCKKKSSTVLNRHLYLPLLRLGFLERALLGMQIKLITEDFENSVFSPCELRSFYASFAWGAAAAFKDDVFSSAAYVNRVW